MSASFSASPGLGNPALQPKYLGNLPFCWDWRLFPRSCWSKAAFGRGNEISCWIRSIRDNEIVNPWCGDSKGSIKHRTRLSLNQEIQGKKGIKGNFQKHWQVNITDASSTNQGERQDLFWVTKQMKRTSLERLGRVRGNTYFTKIVKQMLCREFIGLNFYFSVW